MNTKRFIDRILYAKDIRTTKNVIKWLDAMPRYRKCNGKYHEYNTYNSVLDRSQDQGAYAHCALGVAQVALDTTHNHTALCRMLGLEGCDGKFHKGWVGGGRADNVVELNDAAFHTFGGMNPNFTGLRAFILANLDTVFPPRIAGYLKCYYAKKP